MSTSENRIDLIKSLNFSEEKQQQFLIKLWDLLKWQAKKYNGTDSTSMPIERARDLLESLIYTFSVVAEEDKISADTLLQKDFEEVIKRGQAILDDKRKNLHHKLAKLCLEAPDISNAYYIDTIKNLGVFFKKYDIYYEAHQIPCSIDYLLLSPIPEDIKGISFIEEYISCIETENQFINCFELKTVIGLLQKVIPDYKEEYANLCEPVFISAVGRMILGYKTDSLDIAQEDVLLLNNCLKDKSKEELFALITSAVEMLCREIGFDKDKASYFAETVNSLIMRIEIATKSGCLSNVFVPSLK